METEAAVKVRSTFIEATLQMFFVQGMVGFQIERCNLGVEHFKFVGELKLLFFPVYLGLSPKIRPSEEDRYGAGWFLMWPSFNSGTVCRHTPVVREADSNHSLHISGRQTHPANDAQISTPHRPPLSGAVAENP